MFKKIFGTTEIVEVLDFLADHVRYSYSIKEIQEKWNPRLINISPQKALDILVGYGLVKRVEPNGEHYQLNTKNPIVASILKFDFEQGKKEFDEVSKDF